MEYDGTQIDSPAKYPGGLTEIGRSQPIRVALQHEINQLEKALVNKRELLKLLDENPVIEKFINLQRGY